MSRASQTAHLTVDAVVAGRSPMACTACGATFLGQAGGRCSACGQGVLEAAEVYELGEPERHVPDADGLVGVQRSLEQAVGSVRYRTAELTVERLMERAERSWWPLWLVDGEQLGTFTARAGTDYQVKSSREVLQGGVWVTKPHMDTRIRWEERVGQVRLRYDNLVVEALRHHHAWAEHLGGLDGAGAKQGSPPDGLIRLPDRHPREAMPQAEVAFQRAAAATCREALGADHLDDVMFEGELADQHWTWLLVPVWTTAYRDDAGEEHTLWVSGVTGRVWGPMMASQRKGLLWAALWLVLGLTFLAGSAVVGLIGIVLWPLLLVAAVGGAVGMFLMAVALWPALAPWRHNRAQRALEVPR